MSEIVPHAHSQSYEKTLESLASKNFKCVCLSTSLEQIWNNPKKDLEQDLKLLSESERSPIKTQTKLVPEKILTSLTQAWECSWTSLLYVVFLHLQPREFVTLGVQIPTSNELISRREAM